MIALPPPALVATPPPALRICRLLTHVRPICPRRLPAAPFARALRPPGFSGPWASGGYAVCLDAHSNGAPVGSRHCVLDIFQVEAAGRLQAGPGFGGPPHFLHVSLYARRGSLVAPDRSGFAGTALAWPAASKPARARAGLLRAKRRRAIFLGRMRWSARSGELVLAPAFPAGGELGDHLIFHWRRGAIDYAMTLHAWEPLPRAVSTLRAIVASA
jgi:hypothetical protein